MNSTFDRIDPVLLQRGRTLGILPEASALACALRDNIKTVVIVPSRSGAVRLFSDIRLLGHPAPFFLEEPPLDEGLLHGEESFLRRGHIFSEWKASENGILITTPGGVTTPFRFGAAGLTLEKGAETGRNALTSWLSENGYRLVDIVWRPGEYASRGGIVDFFDPSERAPLRVEFFDEEIDSLRFFQPRTQRSFKNTDAFVLRSANRSDGQRKGMLWGDFRLILADPKKHDISYGSFYELYNALVQPENRLSGDAYQEFLLAVGKNTVIRVDAPGEVSSDAVLPFAAVPFFKGDLRAAKSYVSSQLDAGFSVTVTTRNLKGGSFPPRCRFIHGDSLSAGCVVLDRKEVWLSDAELYGISEVELDNIDHGMPVDLESSLKEGQWVVHEDYGVCKLLYTSKEEFAGQDYEAITLLFADNDRLIIPASQLYKLTSWNGDGEPEPDRLNSKRWGNAWKKAEAQIEAEAQELLNLYAGRELARGRACAPDGDLVRLFEDSFPYKETVDQLKAIRDIKKDMEHSWPMDRLIVGDVGYGKTEVVLRAAVKAAENGFQTAIIAPTTVLALQHFRTCISRLGELPVKAELLTRMIPPKAQKKILDDVAQGKVDILIGTHRLFQSDIEFKDLGLMIIDEEHRFGVKHKERLKVAHPGLDVLALSATPIPRSLSMAMRGIRDISIIATPPRSRGEVFTVTSEWNQQLAYETILRELERGGQVYYLHNRVSDIDEVAGRIANRFPGHKCAVAHGQMRERQLEGVMNDFYDGKIEILVCTTIIESGLDVALANTLVVDDVSRLGLAQMHQLRGRIGRRNENAYALFFYGQNKKQIAGATRERMEAFGAVDIGNGGYRLAKRDLEIRGAGEILGTSQHGFKERIGYTLYLRKLKERVDLLRGISAKRVLTDITVPLVVPVDYVPQADLRIGIYRRLAGALSSEDVISVKNELADRYGRLPGSVQGMLDAALVRGEGSRLGIENVKITPALTSVSGKLKERAFRPPFWSCENGKAVAMGGLDGLHRLSGMILEVCKSGGDRTERTVKGE